jgi:RNA polymerase sigma-70 factor (ECF subfamily)
MNPIAIHYQPILKFITTKVKNDEDAEDLTQEVFIKLLRSTDKGISINNPQNWLFNIAKNTVIDYYRKKKIIVEDISDNHSLKCEENELTFSEDQHLHLKVYLRKIIQELPEDYRKLIEMSEFQGLSQKEIAEELGMNYTTVRSKIQRGRQKIKKTISDCCEIIQGGKGSIIGYKPIEKKPCGSNCDAGKIHYL